MRKKETLEFDPGSKEIIEKLQNELAHYTKDSYNLRKQNEVLREENVKLKKLIELPKYTGLLNNAVVQDSPEIQDKLRCFLIQILDLSLE